MSFIRRACRAAGRLARPAPVRVDEAFLAASADLRDLERRLARLERSPHHLYAIGSYGILMR